MTQTNQANQRSFLASIQKLTESTHTADFYIMNCSVNRNNWKVTKQALEEAAPTIKKAPLGLGKDYKTGHYPDEESINIGKFTAYEQKGNYLQATATIEDPKAWNMMKNGELAAVSVVITVYRENCSLCGENLAELQEYWREHPCIKSGKACSQIESFKFHRVDFVDDPAYPQAGVQEMSAQADVSQPLTLYAAFYESQGQNKPSVLGEQTMSETPQDKKIAALEAANKEWQEKAEASAAEVAALKAQLEAIQQAAHSKLVTETAAARKQAGLPVETAKLEAYSDEVLNQLKADAEAVAEKQLAAEKTPKAQYGAKSADIESVAEAVKQQRVSFGFIAKTETSEDE
jgi:hypothetical protein